MRVDIRLLGGFEVVVDGAPNATGDLRRRDPARLVKFLALAPGHRLHREQVLDALWPETPPERASNRLHKAAHYARRATGTATAAVMESDTIALFPEADLTVDVEAFERLADLALNHEPTDQGGTDTDRLAAAIDRYTGDLLPFDLYEDWAFNRRQRLQIRHRHLLRRAGRFEQLLQLEPTDEHAHVEVMRTLLRQGDRAGVIRQFDQLVEVLERELGVGPSVEACAVRDLARGVTPTAEASTGLARSASLARQQVGFCRTIDGVRLAYAVSGAGPPLVKAGNWLTHVDYDWESPVWRHWWRALSERHTLVRYDERGCGLSDWDVDTASFALDPWVHDLETVVDALGLDRFPILGISQGGPVAIEYAARHPERVSHVIIYGTCSSATWARASDDERSELLALGQLIKTSWGGDQPGFRQVYDARFLPDGPLELWRAFDELQRRSTSARNALRFFYAFGSLDIAASARTLDVPCLILHSVDDKVWRLAEAEDLHALIPGSNLVRLPSNNHILQGDEPAFEILIAALGTFLSGRTAPTEAG